MFFRSLYLPTIKKWHAFIRRNMKPVSKDEAEEKKELLAKIYMLSALTIFSYVTYLVYQSGIDLSNDSSLPKNLAVGKVFKPDGPVRYVKFQGLTKVDDFVHDFKGGSNPYVSNNENTKKENN